MKNINQYKVIEKYSIRYAIKQLDHGGIGFIVIVDKNDKVVGVLTDGDFRRAVLNGVELSNCVENIITKDFTFLEINYTKEDISKLLKNTKARHIPILKNDKLVDIITKNSYSNVKEDIVPEENKINLPVVIMAGGKGTRLDPFTRILPKALIPIGGKPIIEVIMDAYAKYGMKDFYISVNHKDKMIKAYFEDYVGNFIFTYINEDKPLGTAGALKLLEGKFNDSFFVSNCDIIIKSDYTKILKFHKNGKYDLTIVGSIQHHTIPYGVCEIENGGTLKNINEKPEYDYLVNTGMYLINPEVLELIPENEFYHITHLIDKLKKECHKIGVYPVSAKSWIDVGQWKEYHNAEKLFGQN